RLSSELRVQAALREGLDHRALTALGFQNPDPTAVVNIELSDDAPGARPGSDGVVARFSGFLRGFGGDRSPRAEEAKAVAVSAPIPTDVTADGDSR
ncbi:MAG TPA: hypothetical protein VFU59_10310, partial [Candidatus Eisenbacteria bacterium]|nr:hypothetical protein [Candidatus Eisenbacteria bacterium]